MALCAGLDSATDAAFVVAFRRTAEPERAALAGLAAATRLPVDVVGAGTRLSPGTIHLLPPETSATFRGEHLRLEPWPSGAAPALPIDDFFVSLAKTWGRAAVGVVLSGAGADGARGVRVLHAAGATVFVQEERTARCEDMPRAAIATGIVDAILAPEAMAGHLPRYLRVAEGVAPAPKEAPTTAFDEILALVGASSRVDFTQYKPSALLPRVERRMALTHAVTPAVYARLLRGCPSEVRLLERDLLVGTTRFFRDPETFEYLLRETLPAVIASAPTDEPLRLWVPACASGEEAYTIAMLAAEALEAAGTRRDFKVFATDVDPAALEVASLGEYPASIAADVGPERMARWFSARGDAFSVVRDLRARVLFAAHDVTRDAPFLRVDLVSCRNLMIYLEPRAQRRALSAFHDALRPGRPLLLGPTEGVGELPGAFRLEAGAARIFRRLPRATESAAERPSPRATGRSDARPTPGRPSPAEDALRWLGAHYGPPAVLLGADGSLLHSYGAAAGWMAVPVGRATLDVEDLLPAGLAGPLGTARREALERRAEVQVAGVRFDTPQGPCRVDLRVVPFLEGDVVVRCLAVFEPLLMAVPAGRKPPLRLADGRATDDVPGSRGE
jgi:two-component system CheB/CheR fusion protein